MAARFSGSPFALEGVVEVKGTVKFQRKDGHLAFSEFKHGVSWAIALVMNRNFLFSVSAIVLVILAACGKNDDETSTAQPPQENGALQPGASVPDGAVEKGPDLVRNLRDNSGVLTPEEKAAAIERARQNAQSAARSVGQDAQQIEAAGEAAAIAAQRSFESRQQ
ncbi:hypothetical protein AAIB41_06085 [Brucella sp. BE17]|uniref:hypothetical protein n=1 Tax=Brucella sp. BE17 TaxID=3142977 RepID=UPI0031BB9A1F